ncbi:hypothetical protein QQX98_000416 [Neonectria punicea]|uniref:HNH nuclease domain-containing protein n=1 Tax=Neonectria punicea TaxID=979145 RepID=A0ABR1HTQ2_9HYPO
MLNAATDSSAPMSGVSNDADVATKLYRRKCVKCHEPDKWSKFKDPVEEEQALEGAIASDPIIHRFCERRGKWTTESFTMQSPPMRAHIRAALENYPFNPLVHRWDRLSELANAEHHLPEAKEAIQQLITFLRPILAGSLKAFLRTRETGRVSGRVIIDTYAYYHAMNKKRPDLRLLESDEKPDNLKYTHQDSYRSDENLDNSDEESDREKMTLVTIPDTFTRHLHPHHLLNQRAHSASPLPMHFARVVLYLVNSHCCLDEFAEFKLNGREIKNIVKTAHLLSVKDTTQRIGNDDLTMLVRNRPQALATLGEP